MVQLAVTVGNRLYLYFVWRIELLSKTELIACVAETVYVISDIRHSRPLESHGDCDLFVHFEDSGDSRELGSPSGLWAG